MRGSFWRLPILILEFTEDEPLAEPFEFVVIKINVAISMFVQCIHVSLLNIPYNIKYKLHNIRFLYIQILQFNHV